MATQPFEERQAFHWIIYAGLLLTLGGMFAAVLTASAVNGESLDPGQRWSTLAWIVFPCLIAVNVLFMRTRVDGHELVVQFGYCFPIYRKRIPLQEIRRARVVEAAADIAAFCAMALSCGSLLSTRCALSPTT